MRREVATLAMIVVILMAGVGAISAQYNESVTDANNETEIVNESFTADLGNSVGLDESNRDVVYNASVTVYNSSTVEANNYSWHEGNGTIRINSSSVFSAGESGTITYQFTEPTEEQRVVRDLALIPTNVLGEWAILLMGLVVTLGSVVILRNTMR